MNAAELFEKAKALPIEGRAELFKQLCENLAEEGYDLEPDLSPERLIELDRRAELAISKPEMCRPLEDVLTDIEERSRHK